MKGCINLSQNARVKDVHSGVEHGTILTQLVEASKTWTKPTLDFYQTMTQCLCMC